MTDAIEQAEYEERMIEVKQQLIEAIARYSPDAYVDDRQSDDIHYEGPISPLLEFFQEWRSEIEELGA